MTGTEQTPTGVALPAGRVRGFLSQPGYCESRPMGCHGDGGHTPGRPLPGHVVSTRPGQPRSPCVLGSFIQMERCLASLPRALEGSKTCFLSAILAEWCELCVRAEVLLEWLWILTWTWVEQTGSDHTHVLGDSGQISYKTRTVYTSRKKRPRCPCIMPFVGYCGSYNC